MFASFELLRRMRTRSCLEVITLQAEGPQTPWRIQAAIRNTIAQRRACLLHCASASVAWYHGALLRLMEHRLLASSSHLDCAANVASFSVGELPGRRCCPRLPLIAYMAHRSAWGFRDHWLSSCPSVAPEGSTLDCTAGRLASRSSLLPHAPRCCFAVASLPSWVRHQINTLRGWEINTKSRYLLARAVHGYGLRTEQGCSGLASLRPLAPSRACISIPGT